jgi:hypothetical protein
MAADRMVDAGELADLGHEDQYFTPQLAIRICQISMA